VSHLAMFYCVSPGNVLFIGSHYLPPNIPGTRWREDFYSYLPKISNKIEKNP
jgi:hypothetical protein